MALDGSARLFAKWLTLISLAAAASWVAGCSKSDTAQPTTIPSGTVAPTTVGIPPQIPTDLPLPPKARFVAGFLPSRQDVALILGSVADPGTASWTVDSGFEDVLSFYATALSTEPYDTLSNLQTAQSALIGFHKAGDPGLVGVVSVTPQGSSTQLVVTAAALLVAPSPVPAASATHGPLTAKVPLSPAYPRNDMPLMDDAYVIRSSAESAQGVGTFTVSYLSKRTPSAIADFYVSELRKKGWQLSQRSSTPTSAAVNLQKSKDSAKITVGQFANDVDYFVVDIAYSRQ